MLKEKMKQNETEQKQKMFFCLIFCVFLKAKREEIKNHNFKNNGKNNTDFSHTNVFETKRSEPENRVFQRFFFQERKQHFLISDT